MKFEDARELSERQPMGAPAPTQLAPTQDLAYQLKHWEGDRPEYEPKKKHINKGKKKKKRKGTTKQIGYGKKVTEFDDVPSPDDSFTIEAVMKTRDVPPNYLNRSLSPFFMKADDEFEHEPKKSHINKPKKKKKAKPDGDDKPVEDD